MGIGATSGMVIDDSETFRLDNLGSERITLHGVVTQMIVTRALCRSRKTISKNRRTH